MSVGFVEQQAHYLPSKVDWFCATSVMDEAIRRNNDKLPAMSPVQYGYCRHTMDFPVKAIQVDGGAEFEAIFEEECQRRDIKLFVLPPHSPKLNGGVERAHRTYTKEFYEVTASSFDLSELRDELLEWEGVYNTARPHQALGYVTPLRFLEQWQECQERRMCH